jgi:hypothetical protein
MPRGGNVGSLCAREQTDWCLGVHGEGDVMLDSLSASHLSWHHGGQQLHGGANVLAQRRRWRAAEHGGRWDGPRRAHGCQALWQRAAQQFDSIGHYNDGNHSGIWRGE